MHHIKMTRLRKTLLYCRRKVLSPYIKSTHNVSVLVLTCTCIVFQTSPKSIKNFDLKQGYKKVNTDDLDAFGIEASPYFNDKFNV